MIKRKSLYYILMAVLCVIFVSLCFVLNYFSLAENKWYNVSAKQSQGVILMIGDGMGQNHIKVTKAQYEKETLFMETLSQSAVVDTSPKIGTQVTDSAAAATALATGNKVYNGQVGWSEGKDIENISELAKKENKGVGIVTTDNLYGATPASFSAHTQSRGNSDHIISQQIESGVDLFLGAGLSYYTPYSDAIIENDYFFATQTSQLDSSKNKIFGVFSSVIATNGTEETPTLSQLTTFAISFMEEKFDNGYFLMIESGHIDKKSHANDLNSMAEYLLDFDQSAEIVSNKIKEKNNRTLIITADHETGDLQYTNQTKAQLSNSLYLSLSHTATKVPVFISIKIRSMPSQIDNTDIFKLTKSLLCA